MRNASPVMGPSSTQGATRTAPPPHAAKLPPKSPQLPVTEDRSNAPSFPCPASESETTWTHVKRLAGSHPSITFDSTQLSDSLDRPCPTSRRNRVDIFGAVYHNAVICTERHEHCLKQNRGWF